MAAYELVVQLLATFFAISMFSFLYKDNYFFKLGEHIFIGMQTGIILYQGLKSINVTGFVPLLRGDFLLIIPIILGIGTFTMFSSKYRWISRYSWYFVVGIGLGVVIRARIMSDIVKQIQATIVPLATGSIFTNINNMIIFIGTTCALLYFTVTREHKGALSIVGKIGRIFLMIYLGGRFGSAFLIFEGVSMYAMFSMFRSPGIYLTLIAGLIILVDIIRRYRLLSNSST